jgi:hypothetical protein
VRQGLIRSIVAAGLAGLVAASCSSPATTKGVAIKPTIDQGLCKLVSPSVVATALETSVSSPTTLSHDSATQCLYRALTTPDTAVLIRYDTNTNSSTFLKSEAIFERKGFKLGPITDLGDQAYYFSKQAGQDTLTTVVLRQGTLQLLVTGNASLDQVGSIARYALSQYEAKHAPKPSSG